MAPTNCHAESRGSCVSVSRVITYFTFDKTGSLTDDERKAIPGAAAQKRIQFRKLPPLTLVAHPDPLPGIPSARAMKEEKRVAFCIRVLFIQLFDPLPGQPQQRLVLRNRFLERIPEIRQQAEVQVVVPIGQEPDFQRLDQILDVLERS